MFNQRQEELVVPVVNRREVYRVIFRKGEGQGDYKANQIRMGQAEGEVSRDHAPELLCGREKGVDGALPMRKAAIIGVVDKRREELSLVLEMVVDRGFGEFG